MPSIAVPAPAPAPQCGGVILEAWRLLSAWASDWPRGARLLFVLLLVFSTLAEVRAVVSTSMAPTLFAGDRIVAEKVSYLFRQPSVGEIVLFRVPVALEDFGFSPNDVFIKRVVAKPDDTIEISEGKVIVNGIAQRQYFAPMPTVCEMKPRHVPEGNVFVMGDNPENSFDSRYWGPLPVSNVVSRFMCCCSR